VEEAADLQLEEPTAGGSLDGNVGGRGHDKERE
jgi:hypothetical protein